MESQQKAKMPTNTISMRRAFQFIEDMKTEFGKIQWTEGEEVRVYAKIVVGATFVFGIALYLVDLFVQKTLFSLDAIFRMLFG